VDEATRVAYPGEVTAGAKKILQDALALPDDERLMLAEELFDSIDDEAHEELDEAWRSEILHRVRQVRSGEVELVSWETARERGREALARRSR
jgi:putative addiction module component (TIGR02574 family)